MKTIRFMNLDCIELENPFLCLIASISTGPRILALRRTGGENLLAELPDQVTETPNYGTYLFYGGHRLWIGPEDLERTYMPDDTPVHLALEGQVVTLTQPADPVYGIEKSMRVTLAPDAARVTIDHIITNRSGGLLEGSPWAITMLRPGGIAILPQDTQDTGFLPNRRLTLWPYTDIRSPHIRWGNRYVLVNSNMTAPGGRLKIGFSNPRGWLAYWLGRPGRSEGTLFVKRAAYDPAAAYLDFGSSSACYCSEHFIELETLGPVASLEPGANMIHTETWEIFSNDPFENVPFENVLFEPEEDFLQSLVESLELDG